MIRELFNEIQSQDSDKNEYRGLILANGMKVLLISDPKTSKAAASLRVDVGFFKDPPNIPGLAHFLEHMLFLGTEKYPDENEYNNFLSRNAGTSNACTCGDHTEFYFDVAPLCFDGALDRFAQFFIAPMFTESATQREINAIQAEFEANVGNDKVRGRQVIKSLVKTSHPFAQFGAGNRQTLETDVKKNGIDLRKQLIEFYNNWYSSNIMSLAVYGMESLDELQEMVTSKFGPILDKNVMKTVIDDNPYANTVCGNMVAIIPLEDYNNLKIKFPTEDLNKYYESGPQHYLCYLLGHEGRGSILKKLRDDGLATEMDVYYSTMATGFGIFTLEVELTEEGINRVNRIVEVIFQYIKMLKETGPSKRIADEIGSLNEMEYRFKETESPLMAVTSVVACIQIYPMEKILSAPTIVTEWNPDVIEKVLAQFTPENCCVSFICQRLEGICTNVESWYGTKYVDEKVSDKILKTWINCGTDESLHLPEMNPFIPKNFDLMPLEEEIEPHPTVAIETPFIRMWFKQDDQFRTPKLAMNFNFNSPLANSNPLNANCMHLFALLIQNKLKEFSYDAQMARITIDVASNVNGLTIMLGGFTDNQFMLLDKVLEDVFHYKVDLQSFDVFKAQLGSTLKRWYVEQPYNQAESVISYLLTQHEWSRPELMAAAEFATPEYFAKFLKDFLSRLHVECFIYGNIVKQTSTEVVSILEKYLNTNTLPIMQRELLPKREHKLPPNHHFIFNMKSATNPNSCAELYIQTGVQSDRMNVMLDLVAQIIGGAFFDTIRTKEQLGYNVLSQTRKVNGVQGVKLLVQSSKDPKFLAERMECFLENTIDFIQQMCDQEFENHKKSLQALKRAKPHRMPLMFTRFIIEISVQQYHFNRGDCEADILDSITKEDVVEFYKTNFVRSSSSRRSLSVHVYSSVEAPLSEKEDVVISELEAVNNLKEDVVKSEEDAENNVLYSEKDAVIELQKDTVNSLEDADNRQEEDAVNSLEDAVKLKEDIVKSKQDAENELENTVANSAEDAVNKLEEEAPNSSEVAKNEPEEDACNPLEDVDNKLKENVVNTAENAENELDAQLPEELEPFPEENELADELSTSDEIFVNIMGGDNALLTILSGEEVIGCKQNISGGDQDVSLNAVLSGTIEVVEEDSVPVVQIVEITNVEAFKSGLELYPTVKPVLDVGLKGSVIKL